MKSCKKKFAAAGLTLALLMSGQGDFVVSPVQAAEASISAAQQFQTDMKMLAKQNRRDYLYVMNIDSPIGKSVLEGLFAYQVSPKLNVMGNMKNSVNGHVTSSPFYMEETDMGLISYVKDADGKWMKSKADGNADFSFLKNDLQQTIAMQMLQSQKKVELLSKSSNKNAYKVVVNGGEFLSALPQPGKLSPLAAAGDDVEFGKDILQQIGDVTFIVIVDPVHHEISALKSDLSQPIQHGVDAALNSGRITGLQAAAMKAMTANLTVQFEATTVKPEVTGSLAVPSDVQKTAKTQK